MGAGAKRSLPAAITPQQRKLDAKKRAMEIIANSKAKEQAALEAAAAASKAGNSHVRVGERASSIPDIEEA